MRTNKPQMVMVAVMVCGFAVGMAGFLNFFKYRSNADSMLRDRLVVTGNAIESNIQALLALGLQFSDLGTLPGTLERERATDDLIMSIEIFDVDGKMLYSTDRLRASRQVAPAWMAAARQAKGADWFVKDGTESAAATGIQNNFGVLIGWVALRYSEDQVKAGTNAVARNIAVTTFAVFLAAAAVASMALLMLMNRLAREFETVESALRSGDPLRPSDAASTGPFGYALRRFFETLRKAEAEIAGLRSSLEQGARR